MKQMIGTLDAAGAVVDAVLCKTLKTARLYLSDKYVVKATRRGKWDKRDRSVHVLVTVGAPNYLERKFIKACKKAKEPFPVKKIQLKFSKQK